MPGLERPDEAATGGYLDSRLSNSAFKKVEVLPSHTFRLRCLAASSNMHMERPVCALPADAELSSFGTVLT